MDEKEKKKDDELHSMIYGLGSVPSDELVAELKKRFDAGIIYLISGSSNEEGGNIIVDLNGMPWQIRGLLADLGEHLERYAPTTIELHMPDEDEEEEDEDDRPPIDSDDK